MKALFSVHQINYKGFSFESFIGKDGRYIAPCIFILANGKRKRGILGGKNNLRRKMDEIIEQELDQVKRDEKAAYIKSLSVEKKISNSEFLYARFQNNNFGNYYNIYWKSVESPTGVELVGSCSESEWENISKKYGKSHNYLSSTEMKLSAH